MIADALVPSGHSNGSSPSQDVFVPTPGQPSTTNENIEQSDHAPPVRSSIWSILHVDVQQFVPIADLVGQSTNNVGENIDDNVGRTLMKLLVSMLNQLLIVHLMMLNPM